MVLGYFNTDYFASSRLAKYCDRRVCVSVCLSVCLWVCPLAYLRSTCPQFLIMLFPVVARFSSDDIAICYVLPVTWMTSYFHIRWIGSSGRRRATRHPCLNDIDLPAAAPNDFDWVARCVALLRNGGEVSRLRLPCWIKNIFTLEMQRINRM